LLANARAGEHQLKINGFWRRFYSWLELVEAKTAAVAKLQARATNFAAAPSIVASARRWSAPLCFFTRSRALLDAWRGAVLCRGERSASESACANNAK